MINFKSQIDRILEVGFEKEKSFVNEVNTAMETVFDQIPKASEYLSLYIDDVLKRGAKKVFHAF
jgi:hypothetical protein